MEKYRLSEAKRLLLEKRLQGKRKTKSSIDEIPPRPDGNIPLSSTQERLWFVYGLDPGSSAYNVPLLLKFKGTLNIDSLEKSINEIIKRHESLRTNFKSIDGQPFQVISNETRFKLLRIDLINVRDDLKESEVKRIVHEQVNKPFDLLNDLLVRATLIILRDNEFSLILNFQHIIFDGWSIDIFFKELSVIYEALIFNNNPSLNELRIQYADYSVWQRNWLKSEQYKKSLEYWKNQLADAPSTINLPSDYPRPKIQTYVGKTKSLKLSNSLYNELKSLSHREGVTIFMTLLTAFKVLLFKYSGQEDFTVGTFNASRNRIEIENLIGFFANTLVLRTDLSGNPTFIELLKRVREVSLDAHTYQDMPFEKLVEDLQPQRSFGYNPLFQVMFDLQNEQVAKIENLNINSLFVHHNASKFDLSLVFDELSDDLIANIEYNTDLFDETTIDRMLKHLQTLLEGIVANPEMHLLEFMLASDIKQENQSLVKLNNTSRKYHPNQLIHTVFEEQVRKSPDAVAIVFEDKKISYQELNEKVNQLSNYLKKFGVTTESLVGVCVERSIDMVIGMLGVLKAGGAYVPLDPAYPKYRLSHMLKDSDAKVLLTQEKLVEMLPEHNAKVILLDSDFKTISLEEKNNPNNTIYPENIFNIIYTSGSTAKPKGVLGLHKSALNRFNWMWDKYPFKEGEICCQKTAISFVDSVWEIFGPLLKGIPNYVISDNILKDPNLLIESLSKNNVTRIVLVPSLLNAILDSAVDLKNKLPKLKYWFTSGEALSKDLAQRFEDTMSDSFLINLYGSSEVAADVTYYEVKDSQSLPCIPIGKPIANTQVYILDKNLNQVPIGVVGELYVGGNNLSRGYLNQFALTSEKFICNPFEITEASRLYKTGDLARFLSNGSIEYKGRVDHQVKIRGYRIELQEIETTLIENPNVKECIVDTKEYNDGEKRLVAYLISNSNINSDSDQISKLSEVLSSEWQAVWDDTYKLSSNEDKTFNTIGWNSSYTGEPIPEDEMRVWVESTVERILSLKPKRVLEIGCGTGLLLFRIAPYCDKYLGTDISHEAINYLNKQLSSSKYSLPQVELVEKRADDLNDFEKDFFDVVIINSVVQYFPNIEYLLNVLEGVINVISPGGSIFIGDVRSLKLLETFHTSVQLHHSPPSLSMEELKARIEKNLEQEKELVIDQSFFNDLKYCFPKIGYVEIYPKRGYNHNEVTNYRYDIILHLKKNKNLSDESHNLDWKKQNLNFEEVRKILCNRKPETLIITRVPNARILRDVKALELIKNSEGINNAEEIKSIINKSNFNYAIEPEDFWKLENELPYNVKVSWTNNNEEGSYDVIFEIKDLLKIENENGLIENVSPETSTKSMKPLSQYANNPIHQDVARNLIPELRSYVREKLPDYMMPSAFVVMESFPLTPNGKINRRALPLPEQKISLKENEYIEPSDELEFKLTTIWERILDTKGIGIRDNFFELGGHSLMAVRLFAQIEKEFDRKLPLATLYQAQTIEELAKLIRTEGWKPLWSSLVPIQTNGSKSPLFIVHGGGGNVLFCKDLVNYLSSEQPIYGLQSVGLDRSVPPYTRVEDMAEHYIKEIQAVQPEGPYYLAGNCFGGLIAFEMARKLYEKNQQTALLVLIESYNPSFKKLLPGILKEQIDDFKVGGFEPIYKKIVWKISSHIFKSINIPLPKPLRSVIRANHKAFDDYRPKFYSGKVTLFVASKSPAWNSEKPVFGWEELTNKELEIYKIPGGHLNIFEKHNISHFADSLNSCLEKSQ